MPPSQAWQTERAALDAASASLWPIWGSIDWSTGFEGSNQQESLSSRSDSGGGTREPLARQSAAIDNQRQPRRVARPMQAGSTQDKRATTAPVRKRVPRAPVQGNQRRTARSSTRAAKTQISTQPRKGRQKKKKGQAGRQGDTKFASAVDELSHRVQQLSARLDRGARASAAPVKMAKRRSRSLSPARTRTVPAQGSGSFHACSRRTVEHYTPDPRGTLRLDRVLSSAHSHVDSSSLGARKGRAEGNIRGRLFRALTALEDEEKARKADQCVIRHLERQLEFEREQLKSYKGYKDKAARLQRQVEQLRTSLGAAEVVIKELKSQRG